MIQKEFTLETKIITLRPIQESDFDSFLQLAQDQEMWQYFALNLSEADQLKKFMNTAFQDIDAGTRIAFTILESSTGRIAGSTSLMNISLHDLRLEIGGSWLGKEFRGTQMNRHAKYAMMKYCFEELKIERVEFKTDVLNERAKQGLRKIGGIEEGVFRSHMTMWNNRRRDSIYFSVIKNEWPEVKERLFKDIS